MRRLHLGKRKEKKKDLSKMGWVPLRLTLRESADTVWAPFLLFPYALLDLQIRIFANTVTFAPHPFYPVPFSLNNGALACPTFSCTSAPCTAGLRLPSSLTRLYVSQMAHFTLSGLGLTHAC